MLADSGYDFKADERLRVYLTNTLEEAHEVSKMPLFTQWLAEEANEASKVKQEAPVMVVLGNPPYSGHSANVSPWINGLLRGKDLHTGKETGNYFQVDGQPLGERNPKWLNDDYVKFIRFAQWRIEQTGYGILAFISNHGYLDNPTFRGMRQSLMETFDDIYLLDLHGNSKKKERAPNGSKDENVFDIQQGVAIGIFVKRNAEKKKLATVRHAHLWGLREEYEECADRSRPLSGGKYYWLWNHEASVTEWTTLQPRSPYYLFNPQNTELLAEYEEGWRITSAFGTGNYDADGGKLYGLGICSHNDGLFVGLTENDVRKRIALLADKTVSDADALEQLPVAESKYWNMARERDKVRKANWKEQFYRVSYRPFDDRTIFYEPALMEIGRGGASRRVMHHFLRGSNIGLIVNRQIMDGPIQHFWLTRNLVDLHIIQTAHASAYVLPLYRYTIAENNASLFEKKSQGGPGDRISNLSKSFVTDFSSRLAFSLVPDGKGDLIKSFGPEDILDYAYAVFHSPTYRDRYSEFLKMDFPRLPLTSNVKLFRELCALGSELVALHLMEKHAPRMTFFPIAGANEVEKVGYTEPGEAGSDEGRVWINREQYFEGVPPEIWIFHVGGYQPCQKWLKDRKDRRLTYDDLTHYQHIVSALNETIRLMSKIDEIIEADGGWPLQ